MISPINRKRSRPQASPTFKSVSFLALALLLVVPQASAFSDSSASVSAQSDFQSSYHLQKLEAQEIEDYDEDEWEIEEADEDEDEEGWEYYYEEDEEYDEEYDNDEDYWTPEQIEEMDALYERYLQKLDAKFGADWQQRLELVVDKEEIYEQYLEFEEQKQKNAEAEEQRLLIEASHRALMEHDEALRVEEEFFTKFDMDPLNRTQDQDSIVASLEKTLSADLAPRTHLVVLGTGLGQNKNIHQSNNDKNNNAQECSAKPTTTTIVTTQKGNTHTVIGSI